MELKRHLFYVNMKEEFTDKMYIIELASKAIEIQGYTTMYTPIRGGTDGAKLTFKGVPTPNLGTGGLFCHGPHELLCIEDLKEMVNIAENIVRLTAERKHPSQTVSPPITVSLNARITASISVL